MSVRVTLPGASSPASFVPPSKGTYADVTSVTVDVLDGSTPLISGQALTSSAGAWSATLSNLPLGIKLTFHGHAYNSSSAEIFGGQADQILTGIGDQIALPLSPLYDTSGMRLPRIDSLTVSSPVDLSSATRPALTVNVSGNPGETLTLAITSPAGGGSFALSSSSVTLEGSTGSVTADYTAPASAGTFTHSVRVTNSQDNYVERQFQVQVCSGCTPATANTAPQITSLDGASDSADTTVTWTAGVSDDGGTGAGNLTYAWSFDGTATFDTTNVNPASLVGFTAGDFGNVKLVLTDAGGLSATASLFIYANEFFTGNITVSSLPGSTTWSQVEGGWANGLGVRSDGSLWAWGYNANGELGLGYYSSAKNALVPTRVGNGTSWAEVRASNNSSGFSLARTTGNALYSWGYNYNGQLGQGSTSATPTTTPTQVTALSGVTAIAAGTDYGVALLTGGTVYAWGANTAGSLGIGTTSQTSSPTLVCVAYVSSCTTYLGNVAAIAAGGDTTLAVTTGGQLFAWGYNNYGQVGDGTTTNRTVATQIGTDSNWSKVAMGGNSAYAIKTDGSLYAWGRNNNGQLGVGDTSDRSTPTRVGAMGDVWLAIAAGDNHALAIKSTTGSTSDTTGTLWAWGYNYYGQLGAGDTSYRATPAQVGSLSTWKAVANGYNESLAIQADGSLWAWGQNSKGQLGLSDTTDRTKPVQVPANDVTVTTPPQ